MIYNIIACGSRGVNVAITLLERSKQVVCIDESPTHQLVALTSDQMKAYIREQGIEMTDFSRL